jgi:hypothetical protein
MSDSKEKLKEALRWAQEVELMLLNNAKGRAAYEKMQMLQGWVTEALREELGVESPWEN